MVVIILDVNTFSLVFFPLRERKKIEDKNQIGNSGSSCPFSVVKLVKKLEINLLLKESTVCPRDRRTTVKRVLTGLGK